MKPLIERTIHKGKTIQKQYSFENGYGASVIQGEFSYGGEQGLYELAILHGNPDPRLASLCYQTPICNDVMGYLTAEQVEEILLDISVLPFNSSCSHDYKNGE